MLCRDGELELNACVGDCNRDGTVAINELIIGVRLALSGVGAADCRAMDIHGDGQVTVADLIAGVVATLAGCPAA